MVSADEGSTLCIVLDLMPNSKQKRQLFLVRPSYLVTDLLEDIKRQYEYDEFNLKLQTSKRADKSIYLNHYKEKTLFEAGIIFDQNSRNTLVIEETKRTHTVETRTSYSTTEKLTTTKTHIMETNGLTNGDTMDHEIDDSCSSTKKSVTENEICSDDDLALGASASPTETSSPNIPIIYNVPILRDSKLPQVPQSLSINEQPNKKDEADDVMDSVADTRNNAYESATNKNYEEENWDSLCAGEDTNNKKKQSTNRRLAYLDSSPSTSTGLIQLLPFTDRPHFVGLVNQAMTCYLNSLLQALFMTPEFRNALYNWEFDGNGEAKSIPYQLQKLFLNLQTSTKSAVETTDLTKSFGWDSTEAWQQHDIQELCRVMFDALEQKFKNTKQADLINQLYEGKMTDYVKCLECSTEKSREDTFLDIPLPVRPFGAQIAYNSVEEALRAFVQPETLDGNNQYHCETCNKKCDAHKGLKFTKFPYILTLHLKRFDFDYQTLHRIKLNDKVTFPQTLNLNGFVNQTDPTLTPNGQPTPSSDNVSLGHESVESAVKCDDCSTTDSGSALEEDVSLGGAHSTNNQDPDLQDDDEGIDMNGDGKSTASISNDSGPYLYELFAIMIHSGSASGGHYYAYIKDFESAQWFSFNDQTVSPITQEDIQKSFGGAGYKAFLSAYSSSTNAYMLMYRQMDPGRNAKFIKEIEFPDHIKTLRENLKEREESDRNYRDTYQSDILKIKVYFYNPKLKKMTDTKLYTAGDSTLEEAVEEAHKRLVKQLGPVSFCRLVAYDSTSETIERSLEGREKDTMQDIMTSLKNSTELLLEMRNEDEEFDVYMPGGIITKVYSVDLQTADIDGPIQVRGLHNGTVMDYKKAVAKKFRMNSSQIVIAKIVATGNQNTGEEFSCSTASILENDTITLMEEQLHLSHRVFVAETNGPVTEETKQRMKKIVERFEHIISLYFILPNTDKENLEKLQIPVYECENLNTELASPNAKTPTTPTAGKLSVASFDCVDAMCYVNPSPVPTHVNNVNAHHLAPSHLADVNAAGDRRTSPLPPLEPIECNSEDSSLSDSDRTLVDPAQDDLSHISSTSNSPASSDPQLSSPDCDLVSSDNDIEMTATNSVPTVTVQQQRNRSNYFRATPYVELNSSMDTEAQNMLKVLVDRSMTIETLKHHLQPILRVTHQYFKLFYASNSQSEITRLTDTLSSFKDGERLQIELGRVLQPGEYKSKLYYLNLKEIDDDTERIPFLCDWILKENEEVGTALDNILAHIKKMDAKYSHLTRENCWLRKKTYKNLSKVFLPDQKFVEHILLFTHGNDFVLEEIDENTPRVTDPDDVAVFARRWYPSTRTLGDFHEVVIPNSKGELVQILSDVSGIPKENLEYTKLMNSFPRNGMSPISIPGLAWDSRELYNDDLINGDGALYFYKDKTEPLKELTTEEREQITNKQVYELNSTNRTTNYSPKRERALKIHLDWSPKKQDD